MTPDFHFDSQHPMFNGHFPGFPVVPGVMILQKVELSLLDNYSSYQINEITQVKFLQTASPDQTLQISLTETNNALHKKTVKFSVTTKKEKTMFAQGIVKLEKVEISSE